MFSFARESSAAGVLPCAAIYRFHSEGVYRSERVVHDWEMRSTRAAYVQRLAKMVSRFVRRL